MPIAAVHAPEPAPTIDALRWRERVVLIFAGRDKEPSRKQAAALEGADAGRRDRDLRIAIVGHDRVEGLADEAAALRKRFEVMDGAFMVLLIGKDGRVAYRSATPVATADLFRRIDAMPMRRDEMRQRGR